jgi:hypothetical protein
MEDDNTWVTLTAKSHQITYLPTAKARFMAKHIADEYVNQAGIEGETQREKALKEIWVKV